MGQYHKTFNLTKKQFINPHKLGDGLKLLEQCGYSPGGTNDALHLLLACSSGRGGGDFQSESSWIGGWAGDRIAVIGDYAEPDDIQGFDAKQIYHDSNESKNGWMDITDIIKPIMEREYELVYVGEGWQRRVQFFDISGYESSCGVGDRIVRIDGKEYLSSEVVEALKKLSPSAAPPYNIEELGAKQLKKKKVC